MSERKNKRTKTVGEDTARKIWLAGIGAYGRAFSEAQDSLTKWTKNSSEAFDDLVQKGEVIETMVAVKSKDIASDVAEKVGGGFDMDDRINKMRNRMKYMDRDSSVDIQERLDILEAKLDQILTLLKDQSGASKKAPKKTPIKQRSLNKAAGKKTSGKKVSSAKAGK